MTERRNRGFLSKASRNNASSQKDAALMPAERLIALSIMYQAERQDKANNLLAALALIAAALAYLGIAAILLSNAKLPGGPWTHVMLSFPLWVAASFQLLLVWSGVVTSRSIQCIEQQMANLPDPHSGARVRPHARPTSQPFNVYEQPASLRIQSIICYGGIWAVVILFSAVCLSTAARGSGWSSVPVVFSGSIYAVLLAFDIAAWIHVSSVARRVNYPTRGQDV
jgi:hypothetical protein